MSKFYTYGAWEQTFKPIKNTLRNTDFQEITFETYGEEFEFVQKADNNHIWTEVDGDSGTYIIAGYHFVNRIHYYITENPWEDEYTEIPTWCYRDCDCAERILEEKYEAEEIDFSTPDYDPNCEECEEGTIDIPVDTVEDLKKIYGEDNADIVA